MKPYQRGDVVIIDVPMLAPTAIFRPVSVRGWLCKTMSAISFLPPALSFP